MGNRKRVYVSSTFVDLQSFRKKVLERLRGSNSITLAMEDYPAFDERPPDKCLADIANCDIYVGILAKRYGYVPEDNNPEGLSITEMEYRKAGDAGLMRLMFQLDPEEPWLGKFDDKATGEGDAGKRIDRFRTEVFKRHGVRIFRSPDELAGLVLEAILATLQTDSSGSISPLLQQSYRWPAAWDFELYMAEKRGTFVGRDWLFRDIAEWLDAGLPRALLLRADFGVGKSAVMAELVHRNPGSAIAARHFCQSDTLETLHPATFVRSLAVQFRDSIPGYRETIEADAALQERLDKALTDPASALEGAILTPLSRLEEPASHRLLVVDALDEALEFDREAATKVGTLVKLIADRAGRFPVWLRILATSRNNPQVIIPLQQAFGLKEINAESAANQEDLRLYIMTRCTREPLASRLRGSGHSPEHVTAVLSEKSLGKFLYAVRALTDLQNGTIDASDLIHLAPGMDSFYLDAFERRFARAGKDYAWVREVLGVLAIAREPLPLGTIAEILNQPEAHVKAVSGALPDFLRLRGGRLTFDHFSMAEWLTGETDDGFTRANGYAVDVLESESRLHRWALAKISDGKAHTSDYLVRHLASHLADADERGRVLTQLMLSRPEWLAARLRLSGIEALIADCDHLVKVKAAGAPLLLALLRNSAHVLRRFPDQLPAQLLGRIRSLQDPANPLAELANSTLCWLGRHPIDAATNGTLVPTTGSLQLSPVLVATFIGHTSCVSALAVLPDGRFASGSYDGSVRVWDLQSRHDPQLFGGQGESPVTALVTLPDGRIASGLDNGSVCILDPQGRYARQVFEGPGWEYSKYPKKINVLAVLADGRIASGGEDGLVVWDSQGHHEPQVLEKYHHVEALAVLADGRIAYGWGRSLRISNLQDCHDLQLFEGQGESGMTALAVLPDGRIAIAYFDGSVRVWDPQGRHDLQLFERQGKSPIRALAALPDGRLASYDGSVHVWDLQGRQESKVLDEHVGVSILAVLPGGRIISGSGDGSVRVWDPQGRREPHVFKGHATAVRKLAVLADGRIASGAYDEIIIWDPQGHLEPQVVGTGGKFSSLFGVLPDGRIVSGVLYGLVVWDPQRLPRSQVFKRQDGVTAAAVLPDGRIASGDFCGSIRVWDPQDRYEPLAFKGHTGPVTALAVLPDGRVASAGNNLVCIWDPQGRHKRQRFMGHLSRIITLAVLHDGRLASGAEDGSVCVWDPAGCEEPLASEGHLGGVRALAALPGGCIASGANDGLVRVWDPQGHRAPQAFEGHTGGVETLAVLSSGRIASGAMDSSVRVWDILTGQQLALFVADSRINALVTLPEDVIVAGDGGGAVHFLRLIG